MYDELLMTIGSRRSGLNQNLALKSQYERALQDLADLLETGREKTAGDQKIIVSSKEEIQQLLDKHKVIYLKNKTKQKMSLNMCSSGCHSPHEFPPGHNKCFYYITKLGRPEIFPPVCTITYLRLDPVPFILSTHLVCVCTVMPNTLRPHGP